MGTRGHANHTLIARECCRLRHGPEPCAVATVHGMPVFFMEYVCTWGPVANFFAGAKRVGKFFTMLVGDAGGARNPSPRRGIGDALSARPAYWLPMMLRLLLKPAWVRFLVWAITTGVLFGAGNTFMSRSIRGVFFSGIFFGVFLALFLVFQTHGVHKAATQAIAGLGNAGLSQAIDAVLHGVVPDESEVRAAATRLGEAYLRGKSAQQLKRQERQTWMSLGLIVALDAILVLFNSKGPEGLYFAALGIATVIALPIGMRKTRRIQRNVEVLAGASTSE